MTPKVLIVGRPNVGKSSLFNRLVGYRKAIVFDRPGVTRDRHQAEIVIKGKDISLIDTGGYEFKSNNVIDAEIHQQIEKGLEDCSLLLWVVDARIGLHGEDERLAKIFRKLGKPVLMVLNKVDPGNKINQAHEFFKLGFEHSVQISAEHGLGIADLQQTLLTLLPETPAEIPTETFEEAPPKEKRISIALVGRPNVGKSSIINAIIEDQRLAVSEIAGTTRDSIDIEFDFGDEKYTLLDTAGLRYKRKVQDSVEYFSVKRTMEAIDRADVVFLILSGPDRLTTQEEKIAAQIIKQSKAYGIFMNKWDLCEKGNEARNLARENLLYKAPFLRFADLFFISALEKKGLHKVISQARHLANKIRHEYTDEELTNAYQVISSHHSEVGAKGHFLELKRLSAHPRMNKAPIFVVKCNRPHLVTPAYAKYWKNALVDFFDLKGVPIEVRFRQK